MPVHFWEEPLFEERQEATIAIDAGKESVTVVTPILPHGLSADEIAQAQRKLLDAYIAERALTSFTAWYYTPMALSFTEHLQPELTVYDCMDELSAFQGAPPELLAFEQQLFSRADVVFAGGASLYEVKRTQHGNVHLFPSSIDREHFASARTPMEDPADQSGIPHPRVGFFGVLDERLDRELLRGVAALHPEWHFILIGPVVKIRQEDLPVAANLHYLGPKTYGELPTYIANWDVAMLPFARNASTRFISPTKTPEYLAAGKPVVSTSIRDVIRPYGDKHLVRIADDAAAYGSAIAASLQDEKAGWMQRVDDYLSSISWDKTFAGMLQAMESAGRHTIERPASESSPNTAPPAMKLAADKASLYV